MTMHAEFGHTGNTAIPDELF